MAQPKPIAQTKEVDAEGRKGWVAWTLLSLAVLAFILVPFALFGPQIESQTADFLAHGHRYSFWMPFVLGGLLAADIVLPVPSSVISTAAGMFLGVVGGALTSFCGMMIGSLVGYWLGTRARGPLENRFFSTASIQRFEVLANRAGIWALILARPVPVLAEASLFFAGISRLALRQFLPLMALSNLGLSIVYAAVGAYAATLDSFLIAFAGAIALPAVGWVVYSVVDRRS